MVLHEGRRFRYPLEALDLLRNLGVRENAAAAAGYVRARLASRLRPRQDVSFEDWVIARFGRPLYDRSRALHAEALGSPPSRISADWAAERISLLDLTDVALRLAGLRSTETRTYARRYLYPRLGMGQLYRLIADDVVAKGGVVLSGTRVVGVVTEGARVRAVRVESAEARRCPSVSSCRRCRCRVSRGCSGRSCLRSWSARRAPCGSARSRSST